ncbi:MAG: adenylate/guanylate cyclase domain-containing protein [Desulfobacterales bacterium]
MTKDDLERKITTVFSADVAGYSRLMCRDEDTTLITLSAYREIMSVLIEGHRGRVVDGVGDNLLAEFGCALDAVACAVAVQKKLQGRNASLPIEKRIRFRIGINYGEVIKEGERLYGTGVNIAARLESLADPGGVCISRSVFGRVRRLLPLQFEPMGQYSVKNICKQVEVYRIIQS